MSSDERLLQAIDAFSKNSLKGVPVFGLNYLNRVKKFASQFSQGIEFDASLLECSIALHNVSAKSLIDYGQDFHFASAGAASKFLSAINTSDRKIELIRDIVKNAGINGKPSGIEGKILQNAVLAEFLGFTGIVYFFYSSGIKKLSSQKLRESFELFLRESDTVELLPSAEKTIFERKKDFKEFFENFFKEFD